MPPVRSAPGPALLLGAVACALAACGPSRTELIVVVESEVAGLENVELRIENDGRAVVDQVFPVNAPGALPLTAGLTSRSGSATLVEVTAIGRSAGAAPVYASARTRFVPGESRVLILVLEAACVSRPRCPDREACRGGACVDAYVDPETLPRYHGALPDGGPPGMDGGLDGGRDAAIDAAIDAGPPDGGPSCTGDAGLEGMPAGCVLSRWPARPTCGDSGDDGTIRSIAVFDPMLDQGSGRWRTAGRDLDGICTDSLTPGSPADCVTPVVGIVGDGEGGTDNSAGDLLSVGILAAFPDYEADARRAMRRGRNVPIIRISGWSGEPDDARVSVWIVGALDILTSETPVPAGGIDPDADLPDPRFDGTDRAYIASSYFDPVEGRPLVGDDNAYIAGGVLVARLPDRAPLDLPVPSRGGIGRIRMTNMRFIAPLTADGTHFENAVLVGRWSRADMLAYVGDSGLCTSDPRAATFLAIFTALLERSLDVRSLPESGGMGLECDAVSAAVPFLASSAVEYADVVTYEVMASGCP